MADKIGEVDLRWRKLNIYGFTGIVADKEQTTVTTVSAPNNVSGNVAVRTDRYTHLFLRHPDGREDDLEFKTRIGFRIGQTATFVWASKAGPEKGEYIAVYNNTSGQINTVRPGNNKMACLPGYTWLAILALIWFIPTLATGHVFLALPGIAYIVFMMWSQLRLMRETNALLRGYQPVLSAGPTATSPAGTAN
jgi:hypothetical protein